MSRIRSRSILPVIPVLVAAALAATPAPAQSPTYSEWRFVESAPETAELRRNLERGVFDESGQAFLTQSVLPQLALPKNRVQIDGVRRRLREAILSDPGGDPGNTVAVQRMFETVSRYLVAVARDDAGEPVVRVNAMMLLGELRLRGGRPWQGAVEPLVAAVSDAALPLGVRIAALNGLAAIIEADPGAAGAIGPAVLAVVAGARGPDDDVAADWMRARALTLLPAVAEAATPDVAAAVTKIIEDDKAPLDLRTRATDVLGRMARAESRVDGGRLVTAIEGIARSSLAEEKERIDRSRVAQLLASGAGGFGGGFGAGMGMEDPAAMGMGMGMGMGGLPPGMAGLPPGVAGMSGLTPDMLRRLQSGGAAPQAGGPRRPPRPRGRAARQAAMYDAFAEMQGGGMDPGSMGPGMGMGPGMMPQYARPKSDSEVSIRRTAWRLDTLGRALAGDASLAGLAPLAGEAEEAARTLGGELRNAARKIIAEPVDDIVFEVIESLDGDAAAATDGAAGPDAAQPAGDPFAAPDPGASPDPFAN